MKKIIFILFLFFCCMNAVALEIVYEERKPYVMSEKENEIKGLVATPLIKALDKANVDYHIKQKPSKRHLYEIETNKKAMCAVGWFKNPQREKYGKYTKSIYQDKPMGIIVRKNHKVFKYLSSVEKLLSANNLILLRKKSYSYGKFIDDKLKKFDTKTRDVNSNNTMMLTLIAKKRADYMFISFEEAQVLLKKHPQKDILEFKELKNMQEGNKRYLICSQQVSDSIIEMINNNLK